MKARKLGHNPGTLPKRLTRFREYGTADSANRNSGRVTPTSLFLRDAVTAIRGGGGGKPPIFALLLRHGEMPADPGEASGLQRTITQDETSASAARGADCLQGATP